MARRNKGCDMKIVGLMATHGRHYYCERAVGMFLQQNHPNKHLIILQNSPVPQKLDIDYQNVTLVNRSNFSNLGDIYNAMLEYIPKDADLITIFDDDDIFLQDHFSEGEKGVIRGGKKAYKPEKSYFYCGDSITLTSNVLEPSWFVDVNVIKSSKFKSESKQHHMDWVNWLITNKQVFVDPTGPNTLVYVWGNQEKCIYHTSGDGTSRSFENFREKETDHGDCIITPWSKERLEKIYLKFK